ncbi:hypothetical protein EDC54_10528 [Samsonia erythrinae]|uniref:Uncharacterized protein n=1 Tax=Samsonia erythrinae TaxID=160434 RepID=A0A4R3VIZ1_9GAMM|nr:hypothetical protein EDC54_10528 [Samsonia erythrinae]
MREELAELYITGAVHGERVRNGVFQRWSEAKIDPGK